MTPSEIILTLNTTNQLLLRGEGEVLAQRFLYPVPVYLEGLMLPFRTPERLANLMTDFGEAARNAGTQRIETRLLRVENSCSEGCLALVRLDYLNDVGIALSHSEVRYAMRAGDMPGQAKIELVEYIHASFRNVALRYIGNQSA